MKITVEPTEEFFMAGDVMCRMWQGTADHGDGRTEPCVALISMVSLRGQAEAAAEGLVSIPPPTEEDARRWAAEVMSKRYD
jgi:hypothetical protein